MKPMACLMYHPFQAGLIDGAMPQLTATSSPQLNSYRLKAGRIDYD